MGEEFKEEEEVKIETWKDFIDVNKDTLKLGAVGFASYLIGLFIGYKISQNAVNSCVRECARCFDVVHF